MKKNSTLFIILLILALSFALFSCSHEPDEVIKDFRLIVPYNWEMDIGDSRTLDYAFNVDISERKLTWSTSDVALASVDEWGRVTANAAGTAVITAVNPTGLTDSVTLKIVSTPTISAPGTRVIDFSRTAIALGDNLQKVVSYYSNGDSEIPESVSSIIDYANYQSITTSDGAIWTITNYGVLRTDNNAANDRDKEQRFMGDRYFYSADTTAGNVLGIIPDGDKGIWTVMDAGVTHIEMVEMGGIEKAVLLSDNTSEYVSRRGMVSQASLVNGEWTPEESDNDGLWTSMYAAGELMRYSVLKNSGTASAAEIAAARESAMISTEAVLLLSNLCMRTGTVEAYVRYQPNARFDEANGRYLSELALIEGGDNSQNVPGCSVADAFNYAYELYMTDGTTAYFLSEDYLDPYSDDWADPRETEGEYATCTRSLSGYIARTYSFKNEGNDTNGYIYWSLNGDGTATGVSTKTEDSLGYYLNGENLRGVTVDASGEIPERLWDDLIGEGYSVEDIIYKGDTSSDELIGHLFLYKIAYDILGTEDAELRSIIANTMDRLAQHVSDNEYMMVDGTGQPDTWSKFNREFFLNSSQIGGAPMTAAVILSLFKVAYYVTGYEKWENEYRMAALDPSYEYAELMTQYSKQCYMLMMMTLDDALTTSGRELLSKSIGLDYGSAASEMLVRLFLNYSDEEMAMLAFYLLFQMEDDEELLTYYRSAIDQWWVSIKYSENPLWYYIYQLAYPNRMVTDAYGNNILETAAWSLSRHSLDLRKLSASNTNRDDIAEVGLASLGFGDITLSYDIAASGDISVSGSGVMAILGLLSEGPNLTWAVAAPDERAFHKYNASTYSLTGNYNPNSMEGSTTYTLPFWMGMYHNMLNAD